MSEFEMETIRPTLNMAVTLLPCQEIWIFNDCAIGEKNGKFTALIARMFATGPYKGETYYGYIHNLRPNDSLFVARRKLDEACDELRDCPSVFGKRPTWEHIEEGHRYE